MWGFLKCNYSYTKILIVLLFWLAHLFFFKAGWFPNAGLPRQLHGPKKEFLGGCEGSEQQLVAQATPFPSFPQPPHSFPPPQQCNTKGQVSVWSLCGEPWSQAQCLWHWVSGRFWSGKPGASLVRFREMGKWSGLPAHFLPVCSLLLSCDQTGF